MTRRGDSATPRLATKTHHASRKHETTGPITDKLILQGAIGGGVVAGIESRQAETVPDARFAVQRPNHVATTNPFFELN